MERVRFRVREDVDEAARKALTARLRALGADTVERQFPTVTEGRRARSYVAAFPKSPQADAALALLDTDPHVEAARPDFQRDLG